MASATRPTKPLGYSDKQTVKIITVDKARNRIECAMRDGAMIYAAVWDTPTIFRWPKTEEIWTVRKDMGIWRLDSQVQSEDAENHTDDILLSDLPEGETRILGDKVHVQEIVGKVTPTNPPEVTGDTEGNEALQNLLAALDELGWITDNTT